MDQWIDQLVGIVNQVLGNPSSSTEALVISIPTVLIAIPIVHKIGEGFRLPNAGKGTGLVVIVLGVFLTLVGLTLSDVFVLPKVSGDVANFVQIGVGVAVGILVVAPMIKLIMKGTYIGALLTWTIFSLYAAAMIFILGLAWDSVVSQAEEMQGAKGRKDKLQEIIDQ